MPNILLKIPKGAFPGAARATLVRGINEAAAIAERIPADPAKRFLCWVVIEEVEPGNWTCGSVDMTAQLVPCIARVHVPAGVLDETSRGRYVELIQQAFIAAQPADDPRQLMTSVMLHEVADGAWGANGAIWNLPAFARAAGFEHLQHLVTGQD
ncbi:tautomerase [Pseudomonas gingeri]|uniref:tautomerase n=1 Tax=Pseudomonas gingeri TaxID=117681 RepID=UPI00159FE2CA|nr:tautomerase [Pseudomonas gingeri]NWE45250.1 tautomerase [Pseudomonas gingeri]